jgi:indolepyruvate decarboxylase
MMTDMSTGGFTAHLDPKKTINIRHHLTQVGSKVYPNVEMKDVLTELTRRVKKRIEKSPIKPVSLGTKVGSGGDPITVEALYPLWANFLKPNDILVVDTGTSALGLAFALLPPGVTFHSQTLLGYTPPPAAFGAAVAATDRRVVLVTGDGSHQITAQEISQFGRRGLKPIVFVLNNSGYLIERLLCRNPAIAYNDLAPWSYSEMPHALGCNGWCTARVTTCGEFDEALKAAEGTAAYIKVVTDTYAAPPAAKKMHESLY